MVDRDQPDVVCLQEIKASIDQLPVWLCEIEGYWCYWHGGKAIRASALHVSKRISPERPAFEHPTFDYENRIVLVRLPAVTVVSVYVPNGGKDFPAKMRFLDALEQFAADMRARAEPDRDLRRPEHRAHRHGRAPEGAQAARDRPASRGTRAARTDHRPRARGRRPGARAGQRSDVHVVGAMAEHAAAQHRLAPGLPAGQPARSSIACAAARSNERPARATTRRSSGSSTI